VIGKGVAPKVDDLQTLRNESKKNAVRVGTKRRRKTIEAGAATEKEKIVIAAEARKKKRKKKIAVRAETKKTRRKRKRTNLLKKRKAQRKRKI